MKTSGKPCAAPRVPVLGQVGLERREGRVHLPLVEVAEREAVADRERRRPLRQGLLDVEEGPAGLLVFAPHEVLVREERANARAGRADLVRPAEGRPRLVRVHALVDLPQDDLHEPLAGVVRGQLLERRDRLLEVRPLVRAGDHHRVDEAPLPVRGLLRERHRLLEVLLVLGRRRHRREVVDAHRELRVGGHDLLRGRDRVGPELEALDALLDLEEALLRLGRLRRPLESLAGRGRRGRRCGSQAATSPRERMRFVIGSCSFPSTRVEERRPARGDGFEGSTPGPALCSARSQAPAGEGGGTARVFRGRPRGHGPRANRPPVPRRVGRAPGRRKGAARRGSDPRPLARRRLRVPGLLGVAAAAFARAPARLFEA